MIDLIPAILVHSEKEFTDHVQSVSDSVPLVQVDVADGQFVKNNIWAEPERVAEILEVDCELHLMVQDPLGEARKWQEVPQVKRVLAHYESDPDTIGDILSQLHSYGWEVGVVLNIETPVAVIDRIIEDIDVVQFLPIVPGFSGQPFRPEVLGKIQACHTDYPRLPIAVDGHVDETTIPDLLRAGATRLCMASAIFGNERTPAENIARIKKLIAQLTT